MGRRNTAIKGCHRCKKLVPTATRYCRCGYDFKKPNPDSKASTSAPRPQPKPSTVAESSRRKSERRQRITVKPDFYSPSDYENPFKKVRRRTASDTSISDDGVRKRRGRPKDGLAAGFVKPSITKPPLSQTSSTAATDSPGTPNADSKDGNGSKREREQEQVDAYTSLPAEKQLQYTVLLAEINRKFSGQVFRPT